MPKRYVRTFSRCFPAYHPKAGQPTYFVEKIWKSVGVPKYHIDGIDYMALASNIIEPKHHTIRAGHWFKPGDIIIPKVWMLPGGRFTKGNKQIQFAPDIEVKKTWNFEVVDLDGVQCMRINNEPFGQFHPLVENLKQLAKNDGLTAIELIQWFSNPSPVGKQYQIICWNDSINY